MAQWFSAGTVPRIKDGRPQLLVIDYVRDSVSRPDLVDVKFPGGSEKTDNGRQDENPVDTLSAEMSEEIFNGNGGRIIGAEEAHKIRGDDGFTKHFFLMSIEGALRTEHLFEPPNEIGRIERLGPPRYEDVSVLMSALFRTHQPALAAIARVMAARDPDWAWEVNRLGLDD